jgi:superfamily I DNA/RNA helicase
MTVSKGLEFPVVALPGVGHMLAPGEDEKEAARVFYVAATQRVVIGVDRFRRRPDFNLIQPKMQKLNSGVCNATLIFPRWCSKKIGVFDTSSIVQFKFRIVLKLNLL